ncbi:MAG: DNA polymerase/3'-5' exonuclease PolX [Balneolaceae bacterium]|nr:MAG: DNA polymerase/3'-5' exonuclease PolX [Balneolaceae bacterium]
MTPASDSPLTNNLVAEKLNEISTLMRLAGENDFKAIAFERVARMIEGLDHDINEHIANRTLTDLKGVGKSIADDIYALAGTGEIPVLTALKERVPAGLITWLDISGMGPKKIYKIHQEFGITEIDELKAKCEDGSVAALPGMGEKTAQKILKSIEWMQQFGERCRLDEATEIAEAIFDELKGLEGVQQISVAGSLRRSLETIGDIDILIAADEQDASAIFDTFTSHELVTEILGRGDTKSSVRTTRGRQVDVRIVKPEQFAAALMYFTGSKEHNVGMRQRARDRKLTLNEYGLFHMDAEGGTDFDRPVDAASEADIYKKLDLGFVPPELREDRGEFDWFAKHDRADLLEEGELRGILHAHSTYSDGKRSIREMAEACMDLGYEYLGLTDHSRTAAYAGGLSIECVQQQWKEIDALNNEFEKDGKGFVILKGIESDILGDGSLDYPDDILKGFDFVIASVHSALELPRGKMMDRFRRAIENPYTRIVGHPTGRLLLRRGGSDIDLNELIQLAADNNTAIEINANPWRLDLDWRYGLKARDCGLMTAICPDAHDTEGLTDVRYGTGIARKGWFGRERVLNTMGVEQLKKWFAG